MNRRNILAGLGTAASAVAGISWARIADIHPYDPDAKVPADQPTDERINAATNRLQSVDHRTDISVDVLRDGSTETPYRAAHHRFLRQPSRRRHWFQYTTRRLPSGKPGPAIGTAQASRHWDSATERELPVSTALFLSDAFRFADPDAPVPDEPSDSPRLSESAVGGVSYDYPGLDGDRYPPRHVRGHRTEWTETNRSDGTVTFRLPERDTYARILPLPDYVSLGDACSIAVTFDRETGLLRRIVDEREMIRLTDEGDSSGEERRYRYRIVTEFTEYGEAIAPQPDNPPDVGIDGRLHGTWLDFTRY